MRSCGSIVVLLVGCGHASKPASQEATHAAPGPSREVAATMASPEPARSAGAPLARTVDVSETQFGLTVSDPYRWMEGNDNPEFQTWLAAEGDRAAAYLAGISGREALRARVRELGNATRVFERAQLVGDKLFYFRTEPDAQLAKLVVREAGNDRVLVDPAALPSAGGHASVDGFAASPDGKRLAYNVTSGGSELATIHVLDLATGQELPDRALRNFGTEAVGWLPDSSGFFYAQKAVPAPGVDPMLNIATRLHRLGTPAGRDATVFASGKRGRVVLAAQEMAFASAAPGTSWVVARISSARNEDRVLIAPVSAIVGRDPATVPWRVVAEYSDGVTHTSDGATQALVHGDRLYLRTHHNASNFQIVSVPLANPDLAAARIEVAEDPGASIDRFVVARDALYVGRVQDGRARLWRRPWRGAPAEVALPFEGWIRELVADPGRDGVLFNEAGWTRPAAYYRYQPGKQVVAIAGMATQTSADYTGIVADEVEATSSDGTRVPLSIVHRTDIAHDGARPAIVYGYAGYGDSITPSFSPSRLAWLERGGVFAVCHARGGGEKGDAWHVGGMRENKMNGVHDFEACAQALIDAHLSSPAHLFAQGASMGGVLISRVITDRPDLFAAANIQVGIVNPLRLSVARNGSSQFAELGDPATEAGFRALHEMDAYQHTVAAPYPATMFSVGLNDPRVSTWQSGKLAARMQAQTTSGKPILIRVDRDAGHGFGSLRNQVFDQRADEWSFFLAASGDPDFVAR